MNQGGLGESFGGFAPSVLLTGVPIMCWEERVAKEMNSELNNTSVDAHLLARPSTFQNIPQAWVGRSLFFFFPIGICEWHFLPPPLSVRNILNPASGPDSSPNYPCISPSPAEGRALDGLGKEVADTCSGDEGRGCGLQGAPACAPTWIATSAWKTAPSGKIRNLRSRLWLPLGTWLVSRPV